MDILCVSKVNEMNFVRLNFKSDKLYIINDKYKNLKKMHTLMKNSNLFIWS